MKEEKKSISIQNSLTIFHGLLNKKVNLVKVNSQKVMNASEITLLADPDSRLNALKYRHPLKYLGEQYKQIVVPCTPAYELSFHPKSSQNHQQQIHSFVKVPYETQDQGIASGKRSGIIFDNNRIIRLKGCGNQEKGFNRQKNQSRGHHFYHTAKRQLYTTSRLNQIFKNQIGIDPPANRPLYAFNYPESEIEKLKLANDLPLISKYCCVFETQGDRRAGTHLISPLQVLFLTIMDHEKAAWINKFQEKKRIDDGELVQFVTNFELFVEGNKKFIDVYNESKQIQNYVTITNTKLDLIPNYKENVQALISKLVPSNHINTTLELFSKIKMQKFSQICDILLCKIGYEMGQIKRVMCIHEISWGFYLDHGVQWHCNAHLNNFVVTEPKNSTQSKNYFLLPLDYDLSYSSKQFICIDLDSPYYGKFSEQVFQNYLCGQFSAMQMSLYGLQMMNFKYGIDSQDYTKKQVKMSKTAFRDTLVQAFHAGMRNKQQFKLSTQKKWDENINDIHAVVQFCLWLSIDFQT